MKLVKALILGSLTFCTQLTASVPNSMQCDNFNINYYRGNVGAKIYEGQVYGYHTYHLVDWVANDDDTITETYLKLRSNIVNAEQSLVISYSLNDIEQDSQSFVVTVNGGTHTCKLL